MTPHQARKHLAKLVIYVLIRPSCCRNSNKYLGDQGRVWYRNCNPQPFYILECKSGLFEMGSGKQKDVEEKNEDKTAPRQIESAQEVDEYRVESGIEA